MGGRRSRHQMCFLFHSDIPHSEGGYQILQSSQQMTSCRADGGKHFLDGPCTFSGRLLRLVDYPLCSLCCLVCLFFFAGGIGSRAPLPLPLGGSLRIDVQRPRVGVFFSLSSGESLYIQSPCCDSSGFLLRVRRPLASASVFRNARIAPSSRRNSLC